MGGKGLRRGWLAGGGCQLCGGAREVLFANGTRKLAPGAAVLLSPTPGAGDASASAAVVVAFANGDVKATGKDGVVRYYYAEVDTWHSTHPGGGEVYHFPSGQTEAHAPGGRVKDIRFPDGARRRVHADGREEDVPAPGADSEEQQYGDGYDA